MTKLKKIFLIIIIIYLLITAPLISLGVLIFVTLLYLIILIDDLKEATKSKEDKKREKEEFHKNLKEAEKFCDKMLKKYRTNEATIQLLRDSSEKAIGYGILWCCENCVELNSEKLKYKIENEAIKRICSKCKKEQEIKIPWKEKRPLI